MISFTELLGHSLISDLPLSHQINLDDLHKKVNIFRAAYGKPMLVTSGYRSLQDHLRIYDSINHKREQQGLPKLKVPMGSKHLIGAAVDFYDRDGALYAWTLNNLAVLEQADLYYEIDTTTPRLHLQSLPFGSYVPGGTRGFIP